MVKESNMQGVQKARKKPVDIEYMVLKGEPADWMEVYQWIEANTQGSFDVNNAEEPVPASGVSIDAATGFMVIATLEGCMQAKVGDVIIRGVKGEFYPCKPDIFARSYDLLGPNGNFSGVPVDNATTFPPRRVRDSPQA